MMDWSRYSRTTEGERGSLHTPEQVQAIINQVVAEVNSKGGKACSSEGMDEKGITFC